MSAPESNYTAWLSKAENDFLNIRNNLQSDRVPWDTICFHPQQAAEKMLKAFLVYHGQTPVRTHDLIVLLARCIDLDRDLKVAEEDCRRLTVYGIGSRYPDDLFEPSKEEALEMLEAAKSVQEQVLRRLSAKQT